MPHLAEILGCFPTIADWKEAYLDDGRQRILGDAEKFSVEIILGDSIDHVGIFSVWNEQPEMLSVMELFLGSHENACGVLARTRNFFASGGHETFHAVLRTHTMTLFHVGERVHFRVSPSTDI